MTLKMSPTGWWVLYTAEEGQRKSYRKDEEAEPKWK